MTLSITTALVGVLITLVGALVGITWRSASLATKLLATIQQLEKRDEELAGKLVALDKIPGIEQRLIYAEKNNSLLPRIVADIDVLKAKAEFSREMRQATLRRSRPEIDDDD